MNPSRSYAVALIPQPPSPQGEEGKEVFEGKPLQSAPFDKYGANRFNCVSPIRLQSTAIQRIPSTGLLSHRVSKSSFEDVAEQLLISKLGEYTIDYTFHFG